MDADADDTKLLAHYFLTTSMWFPTLCLDFRCSLLGPDCTGLNPTFWFGLAQVPLGHSSPRLPITGIVLQQELLCPILDHCVCIFLPALYHFLLCIAIVCFISPAVLYVPWGNVCILLIPCLPQLLAHTGCSTDPSWTVGVVSLVGDIHKLGERLEKARVWGVLQLHEQAPCFCTELLVSGGRDEE